MISATEARQIYENFKKAEPTKKQKDSEQWLNQVSNLIRAEAAKGGRKISCPLSSSLDTKMIISLLEKMDYNVIVHATRHFNLTTEITISW